MKKTADKNRPNRQALLSELTKGLEQSITEFTDGDSTSSPLSLR